MAVFYAALPHFLLPVQSHASFKQVWTSSLTVKINYGLTRIVQEDLSLASYSGINQHLKDLKNYIVQEARVSPKYCHKKTGVFVAKEQVTICSQ